MWQTYSMPSRPHTIKSIASRLTYVGLVLVYVSLCAACAARMPVEPEVQVASDEVKPAAATTTAGLTIGHTQEGFLFIGSPDAPLVLYEIFNANCPGCGNHHRTRLPALVEEHVQSGVMQMVLVDLSISAEWGEQAHFVAWCLGQQVGAQQQWQFWTDLFDDQVAWFEDGEHFSLQLATNAGADLDTLNACVESDAPVAVATLQTIAEERLLPDRWSTPVFRIEDRTGRFLVSQVGSPSLEAWNRIVDEALSSASW